MSSSPTTTTPPPADTGFDPVVFWIQHKTKITLLVGLFVVGLAVFAVSEYVRNRTNTAAQELFSQANNADAYRQVIAQYPGTAAAGNAHLLLAEKLRADGKYDDSSAILRAFIDKYPQHQLISGAWTSLAANLEAQGKADEALTTYQKVTTTYANSYSSPMALLSQARLLAAKGKTEDARRLYEQVMTQYADNGASRIAADALRRLKK